MVKKKRLMVALAVTAGFGLASVALAEAAPQAQKQAQVTPTPKGWNYQLDAKGNRIPKGNRVTNADGSWREEVRQGKCTTVKEMSAKGEYKETHSCG
jgi:hypothetical protein